jgi:hypothetical protein
MNNVGDRDGFADLRGSDTNNGTPVILYTFTGNVNQKWNFEEAT